MRVCTVREQWRFKCETRNQSIETQKIAQREKGRADLLLKYRAPLAELSNHGVFCDGVNLNLNTG